jgi:uncharacterized paraquat-inducible protein A
MSPENSSYEDDYDEPIDEQYDESDESDTIVCPACGAEIYEDTPCCPVCGEYITTSTSAWSGRPTWWIVLGVAGIIALLMFFVL